MAGVPVNQSVHFLPMHSAETQDCPLIGVTWHRRMSAHRRKTQSYNTINK